MPFRDGGEATRDSEGRRKNRREDDSQGNALFEELDSEPCCDVEEPGNAAVSSKTDLETL